MEKRYKVLRTIGKIYKILGVIAAVLTILSALGICLASILGGAALNRYARQFGGMQVPMASQAGGAVAGVIGALFLSLYGGMIAISLYGLGEGVDLIIALEENTRKTTELLEESDTSG